MHETRNDARTARWCAVLEAGAVHNVACLGDSITYSPPIPEFGITENWVEQLTKALELRLGPRQGDGYRGLWRDTEWSQSGTWFEAEATDGFDVTPFRRGLFSSGSADDELVWRKPGPLVVEAFELYSFAAPGAGRWQYRVDDGPFVSVPGDLSQRNELSHFSVDQPVARRITIRGHDGSAPCVAAVAGVSTYTRREPDEHGFVVHNIGHQEQFLARFSRQSAGRPFALLEQLRPELVTMMFTNDVILGQPDEFALAFETVVTRVRDYGDVLILIPFEQRTPRRIDDATMTAGTVRCTSRSARFLWTDTGAPVFAANVAPDTTIAEVISLEEVTLSAPVPRTSEGQEMRIGLRRDGETQARYRALARTAADTLGCPFVDVHEAFCELAGPGWDAAYDAGLMNDGLHPSQYGHNVIAQRVLDALGLSASPIGAP